MRESSGLGKPSLVPPKSSLTYTRAPLHAWSVPTRCSWSGSLQLLKPYAGATSTGAEVRANSAIDIALWDILGKVCGQPLYQLLGGATRDEVPIYNTCAGPQYVRAPGGQAVANWGLPSGQDAGPYEDLHAFLHHPAELARELLDSGVRAMKIWPFDPYAERWGGQHIEPSELASALRPFREIRAAVGEEMGVMVELHGLWAVPPARQILGALEEFKPLWVEDPLTGGVPTCGAPPARISDLFALGLERDVRRPGCLPASVRKRPGGCRRSRCGLVWRN